MSFLSTLDHRPIVQKFPGGSIKFQDISSISRRCRYPVREQRYIGYYEPFTNDSKEGIRVPSSAVYKDSTVVVTISHFHCDIVCYHPDIMHAYVNET